MAAPKGHPPYNENSEGGRPKKYTEEFLDKEAKALEEWRRDKNNLFIEDFCLERGYHDSRITEFVEANERFSVAYDMFKMKQRSALFKGSLAKKFSYPMCALILSHNHGIIAKTEQKLSGSATDQLACILQSIDGKTKDLIHEDNAE
ncbi:MAG: hypothetical protein ACH350_09820 [Parachlamydiaceae bacterium]